MAWHARREIADGTRGIRMHCVAVQERHTQCEYALWRIGRVGSYKPFSTGHTSCEYRTSRIGRVGAYRADTRRSYHTVPRYQYPTLRSYTPGQYRASRIGCVGQWGRSLPGR
eukprot:3937380-Rhodomonas_salina.2